MDTNTNKATWEHGTAGAQSARAAVNGQGKKGQLEPAKAVPLPGLKTALARAKADKTPVAPKGARKAHKPAAKAKVVAKARKQARAIKQETEQERQARLAKLRVNNCLCGCGTKVKGRFAQGHDQRVRGMIARNELNNTLRQAIGRHVVVPEIERPNQPVLLGA